MQQNRIRAGIKDTYVNTLFFVIFIITYQLKLYSFYKVSVAKNGQNSSID